jgi:alkylhydroperoxidase family enzyme
MSRIATPTLETATGATAEVYAQIKKAVGSVPNTFAAIGAHGPAALKAVLQADSVLAASSLSKQDQETIKLIVSEVAGCDYCVAAHTHPPGQGRRPQARNPEAAPHRPADGRRQA